MKFANFELREGNHFVAMEYYRWFLNRTFLVLITKDELIGLKVNGLISVEAEVGVISKRMTKKMAVTGDLDDPYSYIKKRNLEKIADMDIFGASILKAERGSFRIPRQSIERVSYDSRKKWGMGYYPHDGRVFINRVDGKQKELIILGAQSGQEIKSWIEAKPAP